MRMELKSPDYTNLILIVLGAVSVLLILAVLGGIQLPLIAGYKAGVIVLGIIGLAMCSVGGVGRAITIHGWTDPMTIAGIVLGILALGLIVGAIFGFELPPLTSERDMFLAMVILGAGKIVLTTIDRFSFARSVER